MFFQYKRNRKRSLNFCSTERRFSTDRRCAHFSTAIYRIAFFVVLNEKKREKLSAMLQSIARFFCVL